MTSEFKSTSVTNLTKIWIDMMRPHTQHIDDQCKEWRPSLTFNKTIDSTEVAIAEILDINLVETKVMLNYKKRTVDAKEKRYFTRNKMKKIADKKKRKYLHKLNEDMGEIQNAVFNAHHAIVKLQPIIETFSNEEEEGGETN